MQITKKIIAGEEIKKGTPVYVSDGKLWQSVKETNQEKRQNNIRSSRELIEKSGFKFEEKANGHFIIGDFDFWASTGLFINRKTKRRGRGVFILLKYLEIC